MKNFMMQLVMMTVDVVREVLRDQEQERKDLAALGARVGHPYVPGEDLRAYRRRIVALRDEDPHRFTGGEVAQ